MMLINVFIAAIPLCAAWYQMFNSNWLAVAACSLLCLAIVTFQRSCK